MPQIVIQRGEFGPFVQALEQVAPHCDDGTCAARSAVDAPQ